MLQLHDYYCWLGKVLHFIVIIKVLYRGSRDNTPVANISPPLIKSEWRRQLPQDTPPEPWNPGAGTRLRPNPIRRPWIFISEADQESTDCHWCKTGVFKQGVWWPPPGSLEASQRWSCVQYCWCFCVSAAEGQADMPTLSLRVPCRSNRGVLLVWERMAWTRDCLLLIWLHKGLHAELAHPAAAFSTLTWPQFTCAAISDDFLFLYFYGCTKTFCYSFYCTLMKYDTVTNLSVPTLCVNPIKILALQVIWLLINRLYDHSQSLYLQRDKLKDNALGLCTTFTKDSEEHSVLKTWYVLHAQVKPTIC